MSIRSYSYLAPRGNRCFVDLELVFGTVNDRKAGAKKPDGEAFEDRAQYSFERLRASA
jgi:hypothetical protein